jgi:hypothetical protein
MAIASVNIPVPLNGDGPVINISNLVGQKTVELTGNFQGQYQLLGGHAADKLVPVVQFDAGGPEGIKQTLNEAYQFVAVRSIATPAAGNTITMSVAGAVATGENHFGSLATLNPGDIGPQPIIDTATLFPPTGLEQAINIICEGDFEGTIVIEGSIDGSDFSPIGQFTGYHRGRTLIGLDKPLEFGPLPTEDKTRYIRINVGANIKAVTNLTIGGQIPAGGGAAGETVSLMTNDTSAFGFLGQGLGTTAPLAVDAAGNSVVAPLDPLLFPNQCVILGANNTGRFTGAPMVVMGYGNTSGANYSVVMGANNMTADYSTGIVALGINMFLGFSGEDFNCNFNTAVGVSHTILGACTHNVLIGYQHTIGQPGLGSSYNVIIGAYPMEIGGTSFGNTLISGEGGNHNLNNSQFNSVVGYSNSGNNENYCILVGTFHNLADNGYECSLVGYRTQIGIGGRFITSLGANNSTFADFTTDFSRQTLLGADINVSCPSVGSPASTKILAAGDTITIIATTDPSMYIGDQAISEVVAIGATISMVARFNGGDVGSHLILIGDNLRSGNADGTGRGTNNNTFIGANIRGEDEAIFNTAIGNDISFAAQNVRNVVITGIGGVAVSGNRNTLIGASPQLAASNSDVVCLGSHPDYFYVSVGTNNSGAIAINGKVVDDSGSSIAIGYQSIVIGGGLGGGIALGANASAAAFQFVVGHSDGSPINELIVQGVNGVMFIDTLHATSNPSANTVGLTITYNDGATVSNKTIQASVSPPPGAIMLYLVP